MTINDDEDTRGIHDNNNGESIEENLIPEVPAFGKTSDVLNTATNIQMDDANMMSSSHIEKTAYRGIHRKMTTSKKRKKKEVSMG